MGICYSLGEGVKKNYSVAANWYQKSANQGNAVAQYSVGVCYEHGKGLRKNKTEAKKWYQKAADQGNEEAKKALESLNQ